MAEADEGDGEAGEPDAGGELAAAAEREPASAAAVAGGS